MEFSLTSAAPATGHMPETAAAVLPNRWAATARTYTPHFSSEQHAAAARVRGVALFAFGCLAAEAHKKCRLHRRRAGVVARREAALSSPEGVSMPKTYYELLGVPSSADNKAIKHAYHSKMKACHPDVCGVEGVEMTMLLNEAYALLQEPHKRHAYDATLPRPNEDHSHVEEEYDLGPVWHYRPCTKEDRGEVKPTWKNRPRSRSRYSQVPEDDRGEKWQAQKFLFVDPFACIACRNCTDVAPKTFGWDNSIGRAKTWQQWGDSEEYCECAVMSCPVDCIHWVGREELQALEHVTANAVYDSGGQLPCPMMARNGFKVGGDLTNPFNLADEFMKKLSRNRKRAAEKVVKDATGQVQHVKLRIQEAYRKLPRAVRQFAWPRWAALKP